MIKVKISNFIKNNKNKIQNVLTKLIIVAIVVAIATIILSSFRNNDNNNESQTKNVYKPTETVIKGTDISNAQYEVDTNIVNKFLDYCNDAKVSEAYQLLSDDCKTELYPTIEYFKSNYYNNIFDKEREYNLQSWISTSDYTVYKIRYTNCMLSTGTYDKSDVYEDYITLVKNSNEEKISIGNLIRIEDCNIVSETDELEVTVLKKKIYISNEEYEIKVGNKTEKTILLDNLETNKGIELIGGSGVSYSAYTNKLFLTNLTIDPKMKKNITIKFKKSLSSENKSKYIKFSNIIKDYYAYIQNQDNYNYTTNIEIKLED